MIRDRAWGGGTYWSLPSLGSSPCPLQPPDFLARACLHALQPCSALQASSSNSWGVPAPRCQMPNAARNAMRPRPGPSRTGGACDPADTGLGCPTRVLPSRLWLRSPLGPSGCKWGTPLGRVPRAPHPQTHPGCPVRPGTGAGGEVRVPVRLAATHRGEGALSPRREPAARCPVPVPRSAPARRPPPPGRARRLVPSARHRPPRLASPPPP